MREILFRGKLKDNGEWVYGFLYITHDGEYQIKCYDESTKIEAVTHTVIPETVGQYINKTDCLGRKIYKDDIVDFHGSIYEVRYVNQYVRFAGIREGVAAAVFRFDDCVVIGNIHDNPDLLDKLKGVT